MNNEEWMQEKIRRRDEMLKIRWKEIEKLKTRSSFWHGKWAIVCHENNVLRRRMRAAPDLLEACKAAFNFVDDVEIQKQVIAAIEKAEGK